MLPSGISVPRSNLYIEYPVTLIEAVPVIEESIYGPGFFFFGHKIRISLCAQQQLVLVHVSNPIVF
jgi:hypothetical protein